MREPFDTVVVGSGAAGIAAAVSAARAGCATCLMDRRTAAGGTGGFSGLTTLCGLFDDKGEFLNDGFSREFAGMLAEAPPLRMGKVWVLPYRAARFREVADSLLGSIPEIQTHWNSPVSGAIVEGDRIVNLNGFRVGAVIDCSGSAEVARAIGAECLATDETTQASAIVFPLRNVTREFRNAAAAAQVLLPLARAGFPKLNFQPSPEPQTLTVKFAGPPGQVKDVIAFLREKISGFENCSTELTELIPAHRAGRMVVGEYLLTGADVLAGRKFPDGVARCAWPIEQWGSDGMPRLRYLPTGAHYEIPGRALRALHIKNLFMAGKTISADVDAIASARVMGCCLATGAAAGVLAAAHVESSCAR
jgi:hypothetical protein